MQGNGFSITPNPACDKGESNCLIQVKFDPTVVGDVAGSVVAMDTVNGLSSSVALSGTGIAPSNPMAGMTYYFPLNEGAGSRVHDASGNSADGACSDTNYFADASNGVGTHFNDTGQQFYIAAERSAFEGVYASPQTTVSSNYVQTAADQLVLINGDNAITIQMMDAKVGNFSSKSKVCFQNDSSQRVTLQAIPGELVGGNPTYQIMPGSASCFHPYTDDLAQAGANWAQ